MGWTMPHHANAIAFHLRATPYRALYLVLRHTIPFHATRIHPRLTRTHPPTHMTWLYRRLAGACDVFDRRVHGRSRPWPRPWPRHAFLSPTAAADHDHDYGHAHHQMVRICACLGSRARLLLTPAAIPTNTRAWNTHAVQPHYLSKCTIDQE